MLVLSRKQDQKVIFPNLGISVEVVNVKGNNVRLGIDAPRSIRILRGELDDGSDQDPNGTHVFRELEQRIRTLNIKRRHELRNHLNTANLSVNIAQTMIERGGKELAEKHLDQAIDALNVLNQLLDGDPADETEISLKSHPNPSAVRGVKEAENQTGNLKWTALVVEDNDNERELLAGVLRMAGFDVTAVSDGQKAYDILNHGTRPDVVLMDMNMPRMDGPQAISKIRNELHEEGLPIFAVSGLTQEEANIPSGERGVTGWFSKPVDPNQLVKHLVHEMRASVN